ncbi:MAG: hypothetical protein HYX41_05320 [Bdellovibrio sp.]|nr:hypothetical protein [Bdellovibrio sp.]
MLLQDLHVYHLRKKEQSFGEGPGLLLKDEPVFHLSTCQRQVWISGARQTELSLNADHTQGEAAYLFLLRFICGLESEIQGETDVFGQFKDAWQGFRSVESTLSLGLTPWVQRLFEDAKEIRSLHLQNMGGNSYGSLIRRMLKRSDIPSSIGAPLLIVGAGQIAQSVAPFLLDYELFIANRSPQRREEFHRSLIEEHAAQAHQVLTEEQEKRIWRHASTIVICVPIHFEEDQKRISWFLEGGNASRRVIHLGGLRRECGEWAYLSRFFALDDLFTFQNSLGNHRKIQVSQAEKACEQRAKLRALGNSLSIPHGWEDLACFA